jgi:hypothetical protein
METKKGSFRFVIFSQHNVYKIPSLHYFWGVVKNIPRMLYHGDGKFIIKELRWGWINFLRGITENNSEALCWKRMRSPFLIPTHLGLGIVNIQQRARGDVPSHEEIFQLFSKLSEPAQQDLKKLEAHCLEPGNFIKTRDGIKLVDYDNGTSPTALLYPFTIFLEKWHTELEKAFIPQVHK